MKAVAITGLMFVAALAAASMDPFDVHIADITILQFKPLQTHIKLTEAQRSQMNSIAQRQRATVAKYVEKKRAAGEKPKPGPDPTVVAAMATLKHDILAVLTPAQLKRTREITLQKIGLPALADRTIADRIGMTSVQVNKFRQTLQTGADKISTLQRATFGPIFKKYQGLASKTESEMKKNQAAGQQEIRVAEAKILPTMQLIKQDVTSQLQSILTPGQRSSWAALQGTPFKSR
jgi:hypothetical protein